MNRRQLLAAAACTAALAGCSTTSSNTVPFETAKAYLDAVVGATLSAAQAFLLTTPRPSAQQQQVVLALSSSLSAAMNTLDTITVPSDWRAGALEAVAAINQLSPLVAPFLGAAAPYLPVAVAVVSAFIAGLPTPVDAPPTPPAALRRAAARYHGHAAP